MAHEFESGFFGNRQPAWHGLGTVIDADRIKASEALKLAGLKWEVVKVPLLGIFGPDQGAKEEMEIDVPGYYAAMRTDRMEALGVVGESYTPLQNEALLEFCEALVDTGDAIFHTAGSLRGGRHVWATCKLPEGVKIAGLEDEKIEPYLLVTNAHDGTRALTAVMTPIRTVCMNTLRLALSQAVSSWSLRHTSGLEGRLAEARQALKIAFTYLERFESVGEALVNQKMSRKEFGIFLGNLVPMDEAMIASHEAGAPNRAAKNVEEARDVIRSLYQSSPNLENVRGTAWAALNAVAEYVDHAKTQRTVIAADGSVDERAMGERRFQRIFFADDTKQRALKLLAPKLAHARGDNLIVKDAVR